MLRILTAMGACLCILCVNYTSGIHSGKGYIATRVCVHQQTLETIFHYGIAFIFYLGVLFRCFSVHFLVSLAFIPFWFFLDFSFYFIAAWMQLTNWKLISVVSSLLSLSFGINFWRWNVFCLCNLQTIFWNFILLIEVLFFKVNFRTHLETKRLLGEIVWRELAILQRSHTLCRCSQNPQIFQLYNTLRRL